MKYRLIYILLFTGYLFLGRSAFSQESSNVVRGKVVSETKEELISAMVLEQDKDGRVINNTLTDMNGDFTLTIKSAKNRLKISYLGFTTQTVEIGNKRDFNIILKEQNTLGEVVVTGQRTVSNGGLNVPAKEVSFAMQKISTKEFEGIQTTSLDDALQGRIAGLDIVGSGEVGRPSSMRIRGTASINSGAEPLIVMNNIPYDVAISPSFDFATANEEQFANLLNINPDDIEEITVLKDAAATSVWGVRGANGVIMIKTKRGTTGATRITYTYKITGAVQPKGMNMLNGDDYTMLMKQAYFNPTQNDLTADIPEFNYDPTFSEYRYYSGNTDWRKEVIRNGYTHDHYLTITGGGERAKYRITGGYLQQQGTLLGQGLKRYTSRVDLDYTVSERMKFATELSVSYSVTDRNNTQYKDGNVKLLDIAYRKMPNLSVYEKDMNGNNLGTYYNILQDSKLNSSQKELVNPVAMAMLATDKTGSYIIEPRLRLDYEFLDPDKHDLFYQGVISFPVKQEKTNRFWPRELGSQTWPNDDQNKADETNYGDFVIQSRNDIVWQPQFSNRDHSLRALLSLQTTTGKSNSQFLRSTNYPSSKITEPSAPGYLSSMSSGINEWHSLGLVGSANYAYKSRYIIAFNFRRDGSTRFGSANRYGNFPGVSLRWNISEEEFIKKIAGKWLTMLSFRPSWGITGNQPKYEYMHLGIFDPYGSYDHGTAFRPENIRLSDLRWEKTTGINLGSDLAVLDNKYTLDFNIYRNHTKDLLWEKAPIPTSSGFPVLTYRNVGELKNNGWEFNLHANRFLAIGNVSFDAHFNIANSVNTVVALDNDIMNYFNADFTYTNGVYLQRIQEGNPFGSIYGFRYKGVYQYNAENYTKGTAPVARNASGEIIYDNKGVPLPMYFDYREGGRNYEFQGGDAIYEDINHDGSIDDLDIVYLGSSNPKFNGGIGLTARWKQLSVNCFMNFRYGNKIINQARMNAENMYYDNNQSYAVNWRWRKEGDITEIPRALHEYGYNWLGSDRFVEDGSFLRLKYLTVNYSMPEKLAKRLSLKQMNFYVTVNNLLCFTKYTGVDPEVGFGSMNISLDNSIAPRSRDVTLGITLGF